MSICPHCRANTIHPLRKWWSGSSNPVRCTECGGLSYVPTHADTKLNAVAILALACGVVAGFLLQSLWPVALGFASACAAFVFGWRSVSLVSMSAEQRAATRWWGWGFAGVLYGLLALSIVLLGS